ncbi:ankyrin repeat-containing domain protein [Flagelloscypha sp. PMI_526]|nr:ankyrin repeat-containing domain protein [Flagelloscypha sp. PMI_526]
MDAIRTKSLHRLQVVLGSRFVYQLYGIDVGPVQGTSQINPRRHFPHPTDHWSWSENYPPDFDVSCRFFSHSEDLTALHFLAKINDIRTTKLLLSLCYPPDVDVVAGELMETPLHIACATGAIQIVQLLCEHLANPSIQDKWGRTPFNVALMNGKIEVAEYLLNQGASPHVDFGTSPLSVACLYGWTEIVQLLLEYHVDLAASRTSYPPLIFACEAGNLIMVRLLLDAGADPNVHGVAGMSQMPHGFNCDESMLLQDREGENDERLVRGQLYLRPHGQTPLHIACYLGYTEIVQLLLERGADTDISDSDNNRPLDVARQFEREELVPILELYDLPMR